MKVLFFTKEFPPYVYGGAGVHVEYLADELKQLMKVDVRSFGDQQITSDNLNITGFLGNHEHFNETDKKLKTVFNTLQTNLHMNANDVDADVIHCHTWYAQFAGIMAKLCYGYRW